MPARAIQASASFALAAILFAATPASACAPDEVVPMVGLDGPETDACTALGKVSAIDEKREKTTPVHIAASTSATIKAELTPDTLLWLCEAKGDWQGIVYPVGEFQDIGDCRVGSPIAEPQHYNGPCAYGWMEARSIQLVAG